MKKITHQDIERLAHELFEKEGSVHGRDLEHWFQAEQMLKIAAAKKQPKSAEIHARSDTRWHEKKK